MQNKAYQSTKENSKFGQLVANTPFADYAIHNQFVQDNNTFIEKKSATAKFTFAFILDNFTYGVWFDYHSR